jgi:pimeloyl-ACP methyl ester carboxylesterase
MRRFGRFVSALFAAFAIALAAFPAGAAGGNGDTKAPVYVFRGGLDIFSTGMNTLADELKAKGIPAVAENFMDWHDAIADIEKAYRARPYPIVIVGHSYGANTALLMSYELAKSGIPVALLVFYDLTDSGKAPPNVAHVLNFRSSSSTGINVTVTGGTHFAGTIDTVTRADLNHIDIDKQEDLHKRTIDVIISLLGRNAKTAKQ